MTKTAGVWIALCIVFVFGASAVYADTAADLPAPVGVTAEDDAEDNRGTSLKISWSAPVEVPAEMELAGYRLHAEILHADTSKQEEPVAFRDVLAGELEAAVGMQDGLEVNPWTEVRLGVSALYTAAGTPLPETPEEFAEGEFIAGPVVYAPPVKAVGQWFHRGKVSVLVFALTYSLIVILCIVFAQRRDMYVRPIAGLQAVDDAIGRATEMGRPILYVAGLTGIGDIATIAAMLLLGHLAKRTAAYETPVIVPCQDPLVMSAEREIVREAYLEAGKPQAFRPDDIFYVTDSQFGYVAAVDGIMLRQKPAANFYMGYFFAESLILAETGNQSGAIQIAGTDADTQLPFFITACDYTLMGEELYAASAYLSRDPLLLAQLKGQDLGKVLISLVLIVSIIAATVGGEWHEWLQKIFEVQ